MDKPRRIGIFLDAWDFGEIANFCRDLGNGLCDRGYDVTLVLGRKYKPKDATARDLFQDMVASKKFRVLDLQLPKLARHEQNAYLLRELRRLHFDLVILNNFGHFLPAFNALSAKVRLISVGHGHLGDSYVPFVAAQYFVHRHVAISRDMLETCAGLCPPGWQHKLVLCHYGVSLPEPRSLYVPQGPFRVVYCGRFEFSEKRVQDLPLIWKSFLHQGGNGRLTLIGDGEARRWLHREFATENEVGTVRFSGPLYGEELRAVLAEEEVVLNVSNWEGLGTGVVKAVLSGCYPVLSDRCSGHRDIIREIGGGVHCPLGDTGAFATTLLRCAAIRAGLLFEREKLRETARQKFGLEPMIESYDALIRAVLDEPPGTPADHLGKPPPLKAGFWHDLFNRQPRPERF